MLGLWGRPFRVEGILLTPGFCTWETQKVISLSLSLSLSWFFYILMPFSLSDQSHIQYKQHILTIHCLMTHSFRGREIIKNLGGSMLTLHVMDHDINVQILLLGYLQSIHLGDLSYLILGCDHHQPSPQTPFVTYVYLKKRKKDACLLAMIHSALVNS